MTFNEFVSMLISVLAGGDSIAEFSRKLVENITDIPLDVEDNPIVNLTDSAWKKYSKGKRSIKNTARKINPYIDDEKFVTYINNLSDGARFSICDKLKFYFPEVNNCNVGEICASLFKSILIESAENSTRKKIKPKIINLNKLDEDKLKEKYKLSLLIESNCICKNHNCCENLYIFQEKKSDTNYKITVINPNLM